MTAITKFMFDVEFDSESPPSVESGATDDDGTGAADDSLENAVDGPEEEEEEEEEELPGYSEAQLEEAKTESFEAGKLEGARDAASTIEKETLMTLQVISQHITDLFAHQEAANNVLLRDGVGVAASIARKLFPTMNEQNALGEIDRLVEHTLLRLIEEPRVVVRVNPDLLEALDARVGDLKAGAGYEGRIVLKDDPALPYGDCRMEWGDGSAARNVKSVWESIDKIIEENLGLDTGTDNTLAPVEMPALATSESEQVETTEIVDAGQDDADAEDENTKETAASETPEGESMPSEEDSGIVDEVSGLSEGSGADGEVGDIAVNSEPLDTASELPEEPNREVE